MDQRLNAILARQLAARLPGLAGSAVQADLRLSDALLNEIIAASLPPEGRLRTLTLHARTGNTLDLRVAMARPAFLPDLHARVAIERQPALPGDPVLVLRIAGGAGGLLKLAGGMLGGVSMPTGVHLDHDVLRVDLGAMLAARGLADVLTYATELRVTTEDSAVIVHVGAGVAPQSAPSGPH